MNPLKHWKVIVVIVLVFAAGAVTGAVATTLHLKHAFERSLTVENFTAEGLKFLDKKLALTPEQRPKIRGILHDTALQLKRSFGEAIGESSTNLVTSWHRIDQELTPEQRIIYQRECQKFREGVKKGLNIDLPPQ